MLNLWLLYVMAFSANGIISTEGIESSFPYKLFFSETGVKNWNKFEWWKGECKMSTQFREGCSCDEACRELGTCCLDYMWKFNSNNTIKSHKVKILKEAKRQTCLPFSPNHPKIVGNFMMVDSCLPNATKNEIDHCKSNELNQRSFPVFGDDRYLYKNSYCAKCNNVDRYQFPDMKFDCAMFPSFQSHFVNLFQHMTFNNQVCRLSSNSSKQSFFIHHCNSSLCTQEKATLCRIFYAPATDDYTYHYQNVYCGECMETLDGGSITYRKTKKQETMFVWSATLSLAIFTNSLPDACGFGEMENIFGQCVKRYRCGIGFEFKDNICTKSSAHMLLMNNGNTTANTFEECLSQQPQFSLTQTKNSSGYFHEIAKSHFTMQGINDLNVPKNHNYSGVSLDRSIIIISRIQFVYSMEQIMRIIDSTKPCAEFTKLDFKNVRNFKNCSFIELKNGTSKITSGFQIEMKIEKEITEKYFVLCHKFYLHSSCLRQDFYPKQYEILENKTLVAKDIEKTFTFKVQEYVPTTNGFQICQNEAHRQTSMTIYPWYSKVQKVKFFFTIIGTMVSSISYIGSASIFVMNNRNNNIRGTLYFQNMAIFLLVSDVMYSTSINMQENTLACKWIGMALHWSLYMVNLWNIVISVDLAFTFINFLPTKKNTMKGIIVRFIMCFILSFLLMVIVFLLDTFQIISFNYERFCWIGSFYPALVFYFIPVCIVQLICIICLVIILTRIKRQIDQSRNYLSNLIRVDITKLTIKLILLLGICEIFGLIQIPTSNPSQNELIFNTVFSTIYDIARSLRGIAITLAFFTNAKKAAKRNTTKSKQTINE